MIHVTVETTTDLAENANIPDLLDELVALLVDFEKIEGRQISAHHELRSVWAVAPGAAAGFARVIIELPNDLQANSSEIVQLMIPPIRVHFSESLDTNQASVSLVIRFPEIQLVNS